jgi:hypothetical protein
MRSEIVFDASHERLRRFRRWSPENQYRAVDRVCKCTREDKFATLVRLTSEFQVGFAELRSSLNVIIYDIVEKDVMHSGILRHGNPKK